MGKKERFKIDFCKIVRFDCTCGRRYVNTSNCHQCTDSSQKPTNADRIRFMTDEELAGIIMCPHGIGDECAENGKSVINGKSCIACSLEWLQAESEEE